MSKNYEQISQMLDAQKRKMNLLRVISVIIILATVGIGALQHNMLLFGIGIGIFLVMLLGFGVPTMKRISNLKKELNESSRL